MFYSASKNTWFAPDLRGDYEKNGNWPPDAKEYPRALFDEVVTSRPAGKIMRPDAEGNPVLTDLPAPTTEQLAAIVRAQRDEKIQETNWLVERHHEQLSACIETTITDAKYHALLTYRQALRDVPAQAGFPQQVEWPVLP